MDFAEMKAFDSRNGKVI